MIETNSTWFNLIMIEHDGCDDEVCETKRLLNYIGRLEKTKTAAVRTRLSYLDRDHSVYLVEQQDMEDLTKKILAVEAWLLEERLER